MKPCRGAIAFCSRGFLGLITHDTLQEITYLNGDKDMAWIGIQLNDDGGEFGAPWSSRNPRVVGHISDFHFPPESPTYEVAKAFYEGGKS
jgi:hypothetical protein